MEKQETAGQFSIRLLKVKGKEEAYLDMNIYNDTTVVRSQLMPLGKAIKAYGRLFDEVKKMLQ